MRHRRSITLKRGNALLDPSPSPSRARQARRGFGEIREQRVLLVDDLNGAWPMFPPEQED